jgi:hypothetical protein
LAAESTKCVRPGALTGGEFATLDPNQNVSINDWMVSGLSAGTLTEYSEGEQGKPELAEKVTPNKDYTKWTVTLKPGIKFSDGSPITAADVKASIDRVIEEKGMGLLFTPSLKSVSTTGKRTAVLSFGSPETNVPAALSTVSFAIYSAAGLKQGESFFSKEIASAYARLGTEVVLIEMLPQILPAEDKDIAKVVERVFKKQGIEISTGAPVENVEVGEGSVKFTYGDKSAEVDYLCVAGGRAPDTEALNLEAAGVKLEEGGRKIEVDPYGRTTNPKVFAIGDLVNKKALAHKAEEEGVVAVETAAGVETEPVDQELLVGATFTHPQVASVGLTEAAAKEAGHEVKVGRQKISGEGAGTVYDDKDGIVKLVVDAKYGEILGAHIVGNRACDMIAELVATMALEGGAQELARIVHPHPTVSEAVLDAARAVDGWAIHA